MLSRESLVFDFQGMSLVRPEAEGLLTHRVAGEHLVGCMCTTGGTPRGFVVEIQPLGRQKGLRIRPSWPS